MSQVPPLHWLVVDWTNRMWAKCRELQWVWTDDCHNCIQSREWSLSPSPCLPPLAYYSCNPRRGGLSDLFRDGPTATTYLCILGPSDLCIHPTLHQKERRLWVRLGSIFGYGERVGIWKAVCCYIGSLPCVFLALLTVPGIRPLRHGVGLDSDYGAVGYHQNREADIAHMGTSGFSYGSFVLFYIS